MSVSVSVRIVFTTSATLVDSELNSTSSPLQSAKRKAVVRSFFHHPLVRNQLEGGSVARMVRDYEANSATPASQKKAAAESETSSKLLGHQGDSREAPPTVGDDRSVEQYFTSLLEKVCTVCTLSPHTCGPSVLCVALV